MFVLCPGPGVTAWTEVDPPVGAEGESSVLFFEDFGDMDIAGGLPTGFANSGNHGLGPATGVVADAGATGGQILRVQRISNPEHGVSWTAPGIVDDFELVVRYRITADQADWKRHGIHGRLPGPLPAPNNTKVPDLWMTYAGPTPNLWVYQFDVGDSQGGGGATPYGTYTPPVGPDRDPWLTNIWVGFRLRMVGQEMWGRVWDWEDPDATEPGWQVTGTFGLGTTDGYVGVNGFQFDGALYDMDLFGLSKDPLNFAAPTSTLPVLPTWSDCPDPAPAAWTDC